MKKPQPLLFEPGEVYAFPVGTDLCSINPYASDARIEATFVPTGWSSMLVSGAGHEFDFLAWYRFAPSRCFSEERPDFATAVRQIDVESGNVGTMSATGRRRMGFERLGRPEDFVPVESDPIRVSYAVAHDISVAHLLSSSRARS